MNKRISFLYNKFAHLRNKKLIVNSISKHQSKVYTKIYWKHPVQVVHFFKKK